MNKENAHLFLPLIQALADGKTIQIKGYDMGKAEWWEDIKHDDEIMFNRSPELYRIKPEPRTFEMWLTPSGNMEKADGNTLVWMGWKRIKVQEVLND